MLLKLWLNQKGSVLVENKAMMIFSLVLIFGTGAMMITWLGDYFGLFVKTIENAGVNTGFRTVTWR